MHYFESAIRLRFEHHERYRAHQQIDTLFQERLGSQLPYSWCLLPYPNERTHSLARIRSSVMTNLPGERCVELIIQAGDYIKFRCNYCSEILKVVTPGSSKQTGFIGTEEEVVPKLVAAGLRNGIEVLSTEVLSRDVFKIKKPKNPPFSLGQIEFIVVAKVVDPALTEIMITNGFGKKRMFGFGFVSSIEVL